MKEDIKYQKFKKILKYAILFVLGCIMIYSCNIGEVLALTLGSGSIYSCNSSDTVVNSTYSYLLDGDFYNGYLGTTYQGVMQGFNINFNASIQQGNTYTLDLYSNTGDWRNISSETIQVFGSLGSKTCSDNVNAYTVTSVSATYYKITITFISNSTASYSQLSLANLNGNPLTGVTNWKIDSLVLTDYGNSNTSDIIDNQNKQTETIIDNQNKNNEELKDTITDIFTNDCHPSNNLLPYLNGTWTTRGITITAKNGVYDMYGTFTGSSGGVTIDIPDFTLQPGTYTLSLNRKGTSIYPYFTLQGNQNIGVGDGKSTTFTLDSATTFTSIYMYFGTSSYNSQYSAMLSIGSSPQSFQEYGKEICNNKLDNITGGINDLKGAVTDSSSPDTSGLSDAAGWLPPGPLDSLVNLPINLLNSLLGNMDKTCTNINLTLPFIDKDFTIPCPGDLLSRLGNTFLTFWEGFGLIAGCWCLYKYFINLYKWVESHLSMDEKESLGKWGGV